MPTWAEYISGCQSTVWADLVDEDGVTLAHGYYRIGGAYKGSVITIEGNRYRVLDVDKWASRCIECMTLTVKRCERRIGNGGYSQRGQDAQCDRRD